MHKLIRILGIDPGLRRTGWGVIEQRGNKFAHVASGTICAPIAAPFAERLHVIFESVGERIAETGAQTSAIESSFVSVNAGAAMKLGHARAAAMLAASAKGLPVAEYAPRTVKQALTGTGGAEKAQVAAMVAMLLPGCQAVDDESDALALAICHAHHAPTRQRQRA